MPLKTEAPRTMSLLSQGFHSPVGDYAQRQSRVQAIKGDEETRKQKGAGGGPRAILDALVSESLSEEVTAEQRPG